MVSVIADVASGWVRAGLQLDDGASASECPLLPRDRLRDLSAVGGHLGGLSYQSGPSGALIQGDRTGLAPNSVGFNNTAPLVEERWASAMAG